MSIACWSTGSINNDDDNNDDDDDDDVDGNSNNLKVKLSLCLMKHHTLKMYGEGKVSDQLHAPVTLPPAKESLVPIG
jgi:hypothetical protein